MWGWGDAERGRGDGEMWGWGDAERGRGDGEIYMLLEIKISENCGQKFMQGV
ncbi:hypothetical protein NIES4101_52520 [Calothrix sp. NIES-4101]|nr:hypothetical protein NIES4101_52520 [Calothrix sp. NIES-4101]